MLRKTISLVVLAPPLLAAACKNEPKEIRCDDTTGMAPADIETRKALGYVDKATDPNKQCTNCVQYVAAPNATSCGTCKVVKGTINPNGYCKSWAAKTA
jgi:hypothetical protein